MSTPRVYGADIEYGAHVISRGIPDGEIAASLGETIVRCYPFRISQFEDMAKYASDDIEVEWKAWNSAFNTELETSSRGLEYNRQYEESTIETRAAEPERWYDRDGPLERILKDIRNDLLEQGQSSNRFLVTGGRFYEDHHYPEVCIPEVTSARDAVRYIKANELHLNVAAKILEDCIRSHGGEDGVFDDARIKVYANNHDFAGHSFGSHENYLVNREKISTDDLIRTVMPFFCSRIALVGLGTLGLVFESPEFYFSQRALFTETEVGLQTTHNRPIFNTRDEPHASRNEHLRLHVISGDSNKAEWALYLKFGTMNLLLRMLEEGHIDIDKFLLEKPVSAMREWNSDFNTDWPLVSGSSVNASQHLEMYLEDMTRFGQSNGLNDEEKDVLEKFTYVVESLLDNPSRLIGKLDWPTHLRLLEQTVDKGRVGWQDPELNQVSLRYFDIDPKTSLYSRLVKTGKMERIVSDAEIVDALNNPPADTRAYLRGKLLAKWPEDIRFINWESIYTDMAELRMMKPLEHNKEDVNLLLESSDTVEEFFNTILSEVN